MRQYRKTEYNLDDSFGEASMSATTKLGGVIRAATSVAAVLGMSLAAGAPAFAKDPINVGMAVALTGYLASYDGQFIDGAKLAAEHANAAGGIDGHKLVLHILDNASNATTGVTVTNQLLNQFDISSMLNGLSSAQNQAIEPILERAKVPQIVFSVLPRDPKWAFLANLLNERSDALQIDYADKKLHAKKIAIVFSQTPYGQNAAKFMAARAKSLGMDVVYSQAIEPSVTDMTPQMSALKAAGPQAVIDVLTGSTHIVQAKAAATVGLAAPIISATDDVPTHQKSAAIYPDTVFTATAVQVYPNNSNPNTKAACGAFIDTYTKAGHSMSTISGASFGWDAVQILTKAAEKAGSVKGSALHAALEHLTVQGCNTLYKYTPTDHSGQMDVPNDVAIGKIGAGGKVEVVFTERNLKVTER
jgi:branched-chain amino acid transport system substrate-binding protein